MAPKIVVIVGPTASGKTRMAVELAQLHHGEVVSADSMQIYRGMDIGTAKPTQAEMGASPTTCWTWQTRERTSPWPGTWTWPPSVWTTSWPGASCHCGRGTGLYIDSLLSGRTFAPFSPDSALRGQLEAELARKGGQAMLEELAGVDPESAQRLHPNDHKRIIRALEVYRSTGKTITQHNLETQAIPPRYEACTIGLAFRDRGAMWARIDQRVEEMAAAGLEDEVRRLLTSGISPRCTAMQAIGYKEFTQALEGTMDWSEARELVKLRSRQYAKRQLTWVPPQSPHPLGAVGRSPGFCAGAAGIDQISGRIWYSIEALRRPHRAS